MSPIKYNAIFDRIWSGFGSAIESNGGGILDLIHTLLFIKQLDEAQAEMGKSSALSGEPIENPIYLPEQQHLRWHSFHYLDEQELFELFYRKNGVLDFAKNYPAYHSIQRFESDRKVFIPTPDILAATIGLINQLKVPDNATRVHLIKYLADKLPVQKNDPELSLVDDVPYSTNTPPTPHSSKPPVSKKKSLSLLYIILFVVAGVAIGFIFANSNSRKKAIDLSPGKDEVATEATKPNNNVETDTPKQNKVPVDSQIATGSSREAEIVKNKKSTPGNNTGKSTSKIDSGNQRTVINPTRNTNKTTTTSKGKYKIIDKAYFHDQPDESTRREAFLVHWNNSYATLDALDEKNGFIYVVFRNHLNQTSKGWLRKKDLRPVE